jgi:predicted nucleotidyltransferase
MGSRATLSERISVPRKTLEEFCRRWHITKLEVFGSVLRDDFDAESDVDFLASFESGGGPSGIDWFQFKEELAQIVGRRVDVLDRRLVERSRNLYRRHHILREATPIHGS